jgi:acyl carrier protein
VIPVVVGSNPISHPISLVRQTVLDTLRRIAPEFSPADLDPAQPLRDQVDLGSMDWLNFMAALEESLRVDIPESDYGKLVTLDDLVACLERGR